MSKYSLDDIKRLARDFRNAKDRGRPYAFLTGAGCSHSAGIPLAPALIREIKTKYAHHIEHRLQSDQREDYGPCMGCLTPSERKDILKPHLDAAKVNWAHLALAAMMEAGFISRVLTFNFDPILARACGICGLYPAIYDFGAVASSRVDHLVSPSILHLHGQGYGQILRNTDAETSQHAEALEPLLRDTFDRFPLLIIGYSGTADAVFSKIEACFSGLERLCWVDFTAEPNPKMSSLIAKAQNTSEFLGEADADVFLIELARELECWPPLLFKDHYAHLLQEIAPVMDYPKGAGGGNDLVKGLRKRLEESRSRALSTRREKFDLLALEGKWDEIVARAAEASTGSDKYQLAVALFMQGTRLADLARRNQDDSLFRQSFAKYAAALEIKRNMHEALFNWGNALLTLARQTQDAALFLESCKKFESAVKIKPDMREALGAWGAALAALARHKKDKSLFLEAIEKYESAIRINPNDFNALNNWGIALASLAAETQDDEAAEALFHTSFTKFSDALKFNPNMHAAYYNWGTEVARLAVRKKKEALFYESFEKFNAALKIKPDKYEALEDWGTALSELAELKKDPTIFSQSCEKFEAALKISASSQIKEKLAATLMELWRLQPDVSLLVRARDLLNEAREEENKPNYNLACLDSIEGNEEACRTQLEACKSYGNLPEVGHLRQDRDLVAFHDRDWFKNLLK